MKYISLLSALVLLIFFSGCFDDEQEATEFPPEYTSEEIASFPGQERENPSLQLQAFHLQY